MKKNARVPGRGDYKSLKFDKKLLFGIWIRRKPCAKSAIEMRAQVRYTKIAIRNQEGMNMECAVALQVKSLLSEGVWWDDRREGWFWLDIMRNEVHFLKNGENRLLKTFDDAVGFCVPCEDGRLAVGCGRDLVLYDPDSGETNTLMSVDGDRPDNHFNDGKAIPGGRILAGTMNTAMDESDVGLDTGRLFLLESGREPIMVTDGMKVPNGLAISPDRKTAYHADTYNYTIDAYDFDEEAGTLINRRLFRKIDPAIGSPDGLTVAEDGTVFVAFWGGGAVRRFDGVTGEELVVYPVPAMSPTCCCFGGADMDELYITTTSIDCDETEYPLAGSLFVVKPGVKGMKVNRFKL